MKKGAYMAWKDVLEVTPHFSKEAQKARAEFMLRPLRNRKKSP
jgi:hypothetical protein